MESALGNVNGYVSSKAGDTVVFNIPKEAEQPSRRLCVLLHAMSWAETTGASLLAARLQDLVVNDYTRCKEREAGPCSLPVHWKVHSSCMRTGGGSSTYVSPVPHVVFSCARNCLSIALSTVGLLFEFTSLVMGIPKSENWRTRHGDGVWSQFSHGFADLSHLACWDPCVSQLPDQRLPPRVY